MTPHDDILAALDLLHASYPDTAWSLSRVLNADHIVPPVGPEDPPAHAAARLRI
jgi:hypothetical protein